jgi:hypothetical protein
VSKMIFLDADAGVASIDSNKIKKRDAELSVERRERGTPTRLVIFIGPGKVDAVA